MSERWYKEAVIYCVEVDQFADSDGDGRGDLPGLTGQLDYLSHLGVTCLWLNPIHPSPLRDNGYDITDYYGIDPRLGNLGDFAELLSQARERGMRVIIDLVVNHTSDQHPWFQRARSDPSSKYRDYYIWSDQEPANRSQGTVFPGEQKETWTYDEVAKAWYFHRFYRFQPDLNWDNPAVREEIKKVMGFWLQLGVSGFRIDAAPFVLEQVNPHNEDAPMDFAILDDWRQDVQWRRRDAVLLCEANVDPTDLPKYTGVTPDGPNDRTHMLFDFLSNPKMWLALARGESEPLVETMKRAPKLQAMAQWATFLRNHDELDLSRLTDEQRGKVFAEFAPKPDMRLYDRGIRRRLAPMLRGDQRHIRLAYALQFGMPGTPVLRYGDEIGMGENLALDGRMAIRTPMQWNDGPNGGFSDCDPAVLEVPVPTRGKFGVKAVNVRSQQRDPASLLRWFQELIGAVRECPEIGVGNCSVLDVPMPKSVLAHRFDAPEGSIVLLHNLADEVVTVDLGKLDGTAARPWEIFADAQYPEPTARLQGLELNGWGYRWIRLRRSARG